MIYLDNNATTVCYPEVSEIIKNYSLKNYGNPNALNSFGKEINNEINIARKNIANQLNCDKNEIFFTSCATESINWALRSSTYYKGKRNKVITSSIEHKAVLNTLKDLKQLSGIEIVKVNPEKNGIVDPEKIIREIDDRTFMVSLMAANNVTGNIQPYKEIGDYLSKTDIFYHIDAVQTIGKLNFSLSNIKTNFASFSGHKFHGPKGIGLLYIKNGTKVRPIITGGGQERGFRSGTQNVAGIIATSVALKISNEKLYDNMIKMKKLRETIIQKSKKLKGIINTDLDNSIVNTLNVSFPGLKGQVLVNALSADNVQIGISSACSSRTDGGQYVLEKAGIKKEIASCSIRISLSSFNSEDEILEFVNKLEKMVNLLKI